MTSFSVVKRAVRVMSTFQSCEPNCANEIVLPQKYFPIVRMPNELVFSLALWRQGVFTRFSELSNLILRESASVMSQKWFIHIDTIALIATQELLWAPMRLGICGVECCEESFFWCYNSSQVALKLCVSLSGTSLLQSNVWKKFTYHVFSDTVWTITVVGSCLAFVWQYFGGGKSCQSPSPPPRFDCFTNINERSTSKTSFWLTGRELSVVNGASLTKLSVVLVVDVVHWFWNPPQTCCSTPPST